MSILNDTMIRAGGVKIPRLGFGTWQIPEGEACYDAVSRALEAGYRHIDTARAYGNEKSVGRAVRNAGLAPEEVFITSKLPAEEKGYDAAWRCFEATMEDLGMETLDLYLIHAPWPWSEVGADYTRENIETWRAMEEIGQNGRCRAVGVSNFSVSDLKAILDNGTVKPAANQIRYFIGHTQEALTQFRMDEGILVEGYSPLATGRILKNPEVAAIAAKYGVSLPQVCIRYVLQKNVLPLPKAVHPEYIRQNAAVDFTLSDADIAYLDGLTDTER